MASYHLRANVISRSSGRSAVASAAYRSGSSITNQRDGKVHDYSNRNGVIHTEIILPETAPTRYYDRDQLWNEVEARETRKNAQTAREIVIALPHELKQDLWVDLVRDYVTEQFVDNGMVADIAIHAPDTEGDERNYHAHIMLSTRQVDQNGFTIKNRSWNDRRLLETWREQWAKKQNMFLERFGFDARVDHRTLEAQKSTHLKKGKIALEVKDHKTSIHHTAKAIELDRKPQPQIDRASYQIARQNPNHPAKVILNTFWRSVAIAKQKAMSFVTNIQQTIAKNHRPMFNLSGLGAELNAIDITKLNLKGLGLSQQDKRQQMNSKAKLNQQPKILPEKLNQPTKTMAKSNKVIKQKGRNPYDDGMSF